MEQAVSMNDAARMRTARGEPVDLPAGPTVSGDSLGGWTGQILTIPVPMAFHSFGGWKHSLFGDHRVYGPEGVRFYARYKAITQRWPGGARRGLHDADTGAVKKQARFTPETASSHPGSLWRVVIFRLLGRNR